MKIVGIIAEYNPFHNGHAFQVEKAKEETNSDYVIAVMSGNYMQRGIPSLIDKWNRAKIALLNGVDLVVELPVVYSLSSAEFFSYGSISLLNNLGVVDNLCFGSENDNIELLDLIAQILNDEPEEYKNILKAQLSTGVSFPVARNKALNGIVNDRFDNNVSKEIDDILKYSNNILGIEYIKSLKKLNSSIKPCAIKRIGSNYNCNYLEKSYPSATAVRNQIEHGSSINELENYLPKTSFKMINDLYQSNYDFANINKILPYIKYKYYINKSSILNIPDVNEGIENRIFKYIDKSSSVDDLINSVKTKRYTYTRISRILCQWFLGFDMFECRILRKDECPYMRVLGFNDKGKEILKHIKKNSSIPTYIKLPKNNNDVLNLDLKATQTYSILNKNIGCYDDFIKCPVIIP